jgi:shikimate 5-dehydrogenase
LSFSESGVDEVHKKIVKRLDFIDTSASIVQAVNTIKKEKDLLKGYNTDIEE